MLYKYVSLSNVHVDSNWSQKNLSRGCGSAPSDPPRALHWDEVTPAALASVL